MTIKLGSNSFSDIRLGSSQVNSIYLGNNLVWTKPSAPASLLLHFDGSFDDSSENGMIVSSSGPVSINSDQKRFGSGSCLFEFDVSQEEYQYGYLTIPNSNNLLSLGNENFTIELWLRPSSSQTQYATVFGKGLPNSIGNDWLYMEINSDGSILYCGDNASPSISGAVNVNAWNHVAVVKIENTMYMYINGSLAGTRVSHLSFDNVGDFYIGTGSYSTTRYYQGYIDDFRIVKGLAVYTGPFDPPTAPLSATATVAP